MVGERVNKLIKYAISTINNVGIYDHDHRFGKANMTI